MSRDGPRFTEALLGEYSCLMEKTILNLFRRYLELDTSLVDGENYPAAIRLLKDFIEPLGFETEIIEIPKEISGPNRLNLLARRFVSANLQTLLIYNHVDVVPATYPGAFKFCQEEGKIYARGAADSKGNTMGVLDALSQTRNKKPRFNLIFLATTDEETSQIGQLRYLNAKLDLPQDALIFDPDTFAGGVTVASLGQSTLEIEVLGKAAHSGMSHLGENAIEAAAKVIDFLGGIKKEYEARPSKYKVFPSLGEGFLQARCNVNQIAGGLRSNIVPDRCRLTVDLRFLPEDEMEELKVELLNRLDEFCRRAQINHRARYPLSIRASFCENPIVHELNQVYQEVSGEGGLYGASGSTDVSQWANELGLPHFGLGVVRGENNIHGENEFVYIKDVENMSLVLQKFLST